ncbi:MAG TPA: hypothetical protein DIU15_02570, partial [Deltaproteobacteria bacterium]|nr:hypothetical protein [Deltaproteobacteria bacterium]
MIKDPPVPTKGRRAPTLWLVAPLAALLVAEVLAHLALPAGQLALFAPFPDDRSAYLQEGGGESNLPWFVPGAMGESGSGTVRINALGLRDASNYPPKKPSGCYRVLALGDSRTFGAGVNETESWPGILETNLKAGYPSACVEVLNGGMPDTDLHDQVALLVDRWKDLDIDLVLVGLSAPDDIGNGGPDTAAASRPRSLVMEQPWLAHSATLRWFLDSGVRDEVHAALHPELPRIKAPDDPAWVRFESAVADLRTTGDRIGARVAILLLPAPVAADKHPVSETHRQLAAWFRDEWHLPVVDLVSSLGTVDGQELRVHAAEPWPSVALHRAYARRVEVELPWNQFFQRCPPETKLRTEGRASSCVDAAGLRHGPHREVGVDGAILLEATYGKGKLSGPFRKVELGALGLEEGTYLSDVKEGPWWEVKQPSQEMRDVARGEYRSGLRTGPWVETSIRGAEELRREGTYQDGSRHGHWVVGNHIEGRWRVAGEGGYSNGERAGRWLRWQPEGEGRSVLERIRCYVSPGAILVWEWTAFDLGPEGLDGEFRSVDGGAGESNCADGIDDEGDGRMDCDDPECLRDPACAHLSQVAEPVIPESNCGNGVDDDKDSLVDCDDSDCRNDAACAHLSADDSTVRRFEGNCSDGLDGSDADGLVDCADSDCADDPACAHLVWPTPAEAEGSSDQRRVLAVDASEAVLPGTGNV